MSEETPRTTFAASVRDLRFILGVAWSLHPRACAMSFLETLGRVLTHLTPVFFGLVVGGLVGHDTIAVVTGLTGIAAALGGDALLATFGIHERLRLYEMVGHEFDQRTGRLVAAPPTLDHLEDPAYLDRFQILRDRPGVLGMAFNMTVNVANNVLGPVALIVAAVGADLRMLILVAVAAATVLTTRWTMRWERQAEEESGSASRMNQAWMRIVLDPVASGELRVFGARGWAMRQIRAAIRGWWRPQTRATLKASILATVTTAAYMAVAGSVLAWIAVDAAQGRVSVARLGVVVASLASLASAAEGVSWSVGSLLELLRNLGRYRALEDYAATHRPEGTLAPPDRLGHGISLRDIVFTYPGASDPAVRGLDLDLPAGSVVAVVGENGAGKSTLVKLLTGMYTPTSGSITVDGVDLGDLDVAAWRGRCSGAFQDHLRLHDTALTAVTVGDLDALDDEARARVALRDAAAEDVLAALPDGLATRLGTEFGGVDLSGGQWQRLAIARGMMRRDPLLLVLDEPTSALDPATEHRLFSGYVAAAEKARRRGGITVLVTHRFSTVAAADLVVVLADGAVAEVGTHAELVAAGGRYAELYEMQAAGYR